MQRDYLLFFVIVLTTAITVSIMILLTSTLENPKRPLPMTTGISSTEMVDDPNKASPSGFPALGRNDLISGIGMEPVAQLSWRSQHKAVLIGNPCNPTDQASCSDELMTKSKINLGENIDAFNPTEQNGSQTLTKVMDIGDPINVSALDDFSAGPRINHRIGEIMEVPIQLP